MRVRSTITSGVAALVATAWMSGCEQRPASSGDARAQAGKAPSAAKERARETQKPSSVTVVSGTAIAATLQTPVATHTSHVGEPVALRVTEPVRAGGVVVIPAGSTVHGTVTHVQPAGRVKGAAELTIRFTEIEVAAGSRYPVTCEAVRLVQRGDGRESAAEIGGGAAVGGVLGGVIGGKNDVLKGAAIGAAVGTGVAVATKGEQIVLPVGHTISVRLAAPVVIATAS